MLNCRELPRRLLQQANALIEQELELSSDMSPEKRPCRRREVAEPPLDAPSRITDETPYRYRNRQRSEDH